jgi:hypothetical protein
MQLRACLGLLLLAPGACASIPKGIHIVVDGSTLDFKKAEGPAPPPPEPTPAPSGPAPADDPER